MSQAEEAKLGRICAHIVGPEQTLKQISQATMPYLPPVPLHKELLLQRW